MFKSILHLQRTEYHFSSLCFPPCANSLIYCFFANLLFLSCSTNSCIKSRFLKQMFLLLSTRYKIHDTLLIFVFLTLSLIFDATLEFTLFLRSKTCPHEIECFKIFKNYLADETLSFFILATFCKTLSVIVYMDNFSLQI